MKLFQIEYYLKACRDGSISKAAKNLHLSRPAVSKALRALESEVGVLLFERTTAGLALTEAGEVFFEKCEKFEAILKEMDSEMASFRKAAKELQTNVVRLAASPTPSATILPKWYRFFAEEYPGDIIDVVDAAGRPAMDLLENDIADICIEVRTWPEPIRDSVDYLEFGETELVYICNVNNKLAQKSSITFEDICNEPIIRTKPFILDLFDKNDLQVKFVTTQLSSVQQMVENGICGSLQFRGIMQHSTQIVQIPFADPIKFPIWLVWNKDSHHNKAFNDFLTFAKEMYLQFCNDMK